MRRWAEQVSCLANEEKCRRRVLVGPVGSSPTRAGQRVRLWAINWTASQEALAEKQPEGG